MLGVWVCEIWNKWGNCIDGRYSCMEELKCMGIRTAVVSTHHKDENECLFWVHVKEYLRCKDDNIHFGILWTRWWEMSSTGVNPTQIRERTKELHRSQWWSENKKWFQLQFKADINLTSPSHFVWILMLWRWEMSSTGVNPTAIEMD